MKINKFSYQSCLADSQQAIAEAICKYGVETLTLQAYGRAKQVCKSWHFHFNKCRQGKELANYGFIFLPVFKRYVILVNQIDTSQSAKFYHKHNKASQEQYEFRMFDDAAYFAFYKVYLNPLREFKNFFIDRRIINRVSNKFIDSKDKNELLNATAILCQNYYQCDLPKILIADEKNVMPTVIDRYNFDTISIYEVLVQIDEIKKNDEVKSAYNELKELIIKNKLLPLKSDELAVDCLEEISWWTIIFVIVFIILLLFSLSPPWMTSDRRTL